jgi:hypothetical protein
MDGPAPKTRLATILGTMSWKKKRMAVRRGTWPNLGNRLVADRVAVKGEESDSRLPNHYLRKPNSVPMTAVS